MSRNGIRPIEGSAVAMGDAHEPSLTVIDPGLDRPVNEFSGDSPENGDQGMSIPQFAGVLVLIGSLKAADVWHDLKGKILKPRGEV